MGGALFGSCTLLLLLYGHNSPLLAALALVALNAIMGGILIFGLSSRRTVISKITSTMHMLGRGWTHQAFEELPSVGIPELELAVRNLAQSAQRRESDLRDAAHRDGLTGLSNRMHFQKQVETALNSAGPEMTGAMFFVDMDGFKSINDTLGHHVGDRLIQIAADRLRIATQQPDLVDGEDGPAFPGVSLSARFGGDEFVLFLQCENCSEIAPKIASRILRVLVEPFEIGARTVSLSASVGVALYPENGTEFQDLLRSADTAMYHAKRSGRNRYEFYDPVLDEEARHYLEAEQELREAVIRGNLELHFQPLYDLNSMRLSSAEALIRWRHPQLGLLLPQHFLHVADRADLVTEIGDWVIDQAVKRIAEFERVGTPIEISINISPRHLERVDFIPVVKAALNRWRVAPSLLQIEITEEVALRDPELAADRLLKLSELGVTIAIDDFGTGYSNLASLIMLPISKLKIDRSLLRDLTVRPEARVLVQTIITMGNSLGFQTIAEGVETEEQLELLSAMGCDVAQGFLISRPVELEQLRLLISEGKLGGSGKKFVSAAA